MRSRRVVLPVLLLAVFTAGFAAERNTWEGNLPERFFLTFMEFYKRDPSALARYPGGLQNISSEQLHRAILALDTTHFTYLYPMAIRGYEFPQLRGTPIARLSLMAVRGERMIPIPFQFDEYDRSGLIWIEGVSRDRPEGTPGVFDDFDELVFMFRDGGQAIYDPAVHGPVTGRVLQEIRLDSPRNRPRYVYLVLDNDERSEADYVTVDLKKGRIDTTVLELEYDPGNIVHIRHAAPKAGPRHHQNVIDNVYLRISTGILNEKLRVDLDTLNNIRARPVAVKDGPVRASMLVKARIWYLRLPTFFGQHFMVNFHEQSVTVPSRFAIDSLRTLKYFLMFLREPQIEFVADFANLEGARVTFQSVYEDESDTGVVDGSMSEFERRMNRARLPGDWLYMDSNQGWDLFFSNHLPVVENGLFDAFLEGMQINILYQDDAGDLRAHERFPGAHPRIGFRSEGVPRTAINLMSNMPRLDYSNMASFGEALLELAKPEHRDRFRKYDAIVGDVLQRLHDQGRLKTVEQLADMLLRDLDRMRFTGWPREDFNAVIREAMLATIEKPTFVDHGAVIAAIVERAQQRGLDVASLRYATMDNTLWFPDWVGPGGPEDFYRETLDPPRYVVRPWIAPVTMPDGAASE